MWRGIKGESPLSPLPPIVKNLWGSEMTVFNPNSDVGFEKLIARHHPLPLPQSIPETAYFIHSQLQPQTWLNYATIRSAFDHLGVEKVSIWVPDNAELPVDMWQRIRAMQNVTIRPFTVPNIVWGTRIRRIEHASDIARIKIFYEEGGLADSELKRTGRANTRQVFRWTTICWL